MKKINRRRKMMKYRYFLIAILTFIIALLICFINLLISNSKTEIKNEEMKKNLHEVSETTDEKQEENIMIFQIDESKKNEEKENHQTDLNKNEEPKEDQKEENKNEEKKQDDTEKVEDIKEEQEHESVIYLTFDDGPTSDSTPKILDILEKKNVKATFFVLHYNEDTEKYIKREHEQGHTVGLHGYSHTYSEVYQSVDSCLNNFKKIQDQVYQTTGVKSKIIRFPGGGSNTISKKYCPGIMTEVTKKVVEEGFRYFDWNVDSDDAGRAKTSEAVYNNVTNGIKKGRSNVVLMHDFSGNHKTIDALESIIDYGKRNGYVFKAITETTPMVTHSVNN